MKRRFPAVYPMAIASMILAGWLISLPLGAQTSGKKTVQAKGEAGESKSGREKEKDDVKRREEWFYRQRRYPLKVIPGGARQNAINQREAMRRESIGRGTPSKPSGGDPPAVWTPIGPTPTIASGFDFLDQTFNTTEFSGRINSIAVDPVSPNIIYLGGADGGLWKSTDTGAHWTVMTDLEPSLAIGSIAIDPNGCTTSCQTIYVGTGEANFAGDNYYGAGILKSTDGGTTWTQLGANAGSVTLKAGYMPPPNTPKPTSFVGPFDVDLGGSFFSDIAVNPTDSSKLLASVHIFVNADGGASSGIFCSDDAGMSWLQVVAGAAGTALVFDPGGAAAYGALGSTSGDAQNGIYRTGNATAACASQTWTLQSTGIPTGTATGRISLTISPSNPVVLYAAIASPSTDSSTLLNVYKTGNGGASWMPTNPPDICAQQCYYDMLIKVHPNNPSVVFFGGAALSNAGSGGNDLYLLRSENGGTTWDDGTLTTEIAFDSSGNEIHVDQHAMAFSPPTKGAGGYTMFVGNDGGLWSTPIGAMGDATVAWTDLNPTLTLSQFYTGISIHPSSQLVAIGGLQDNGSQKYDSGTVPGSIMWNQINGSDGGYTYIDPAVPSTVFTTTEFIAGDPFFIGKSVTNGDLDSSGNVTFSPATNGINFNSDYAEFIPPLVGDPTPGNNRVMYYGTCEVYQSRDGAGNWVGMGTSSLCAVGVADYITIAAAGDTVYAGDNIGHVHATTNAIAGANAVWTDVSHAPLPASSTTTMAPTDGRVITKIAVDPNNPMFAIVAYSGFCGFMNITSGVVDSAGHIFETNNGGATWTDISGNGGGCPMTSPPPAGSLPNTPVNDVVIDPADSTDMTIYVATDIGVFMTTDGGTTWTELDTSPRTLPNGAVLSLTLRQASRTLRAGLHGRGVWDMPLPLSAAQQAFSLVSLTPVFASLGSGSTLLTLNGNGFTSMSQVHFGGATLAPTLQTPTELQVTVPMADLATVASVPVTVTDPVGGTSNTLIFSVEVTSTSPAPPNDLFPGITISSNTFQDTENTFAATTNTGGITDPTPGSVAGCVPDQTGLALNGAANSIWYNWQAPANGTVEADTVGSTQDTILLAGTGTAGNITVVPGACNDDIVSGQVSTSRITFSAVSGTTYYFMVSNFEGSGNGPGSTVLFNFNATLTPTLTSISPNSGAPGATIPVTLTGTNFTAPLSVNFIGTGGTFSNVQLLNSTTITATLTLLATAPVATDTVTVGNNNGTSNAVNFQVVSGPPTLTSISPANGAQTGSVNVTLTGTNFVSGATIQFGGTGITPSNVVVVNATSITATFTISGTATTQTVAVMTGQGTSGTVQFTVDAAPTLGGISPISGGQGTSVPVTLTGTNFFAPATITISGTGITANSVVVVNATTITATFVIAANATLSGRTVAVTSGGIETSTVTFTVNPPPPTLASISPVMGAQGGTVNVTLTGTNFVAPVTVNFGGAGVTVTNVVVVSATSITAQFQIGAGATLGAQTVSVTTSGGISGNQTFTVEAPPTLTSISPNNSDQGTAPTVTLTGTNFFTPATISFGGTGITASAVTVTSPTTITATFTIAAGATLGAQTVSVTTDGVTTTTVQFTVNPPAPTLTSISPAMGAQNGVVNVTLTGTNFVAGSAINVPAGEGIAVSNTTVASGTSITATFTISGTATLGPQSVSVTTSGGTSGTKPFTVEATPTLTSINPATGITGTTVPVTLTGTNFFTPATINFGGTGITASAVTVTSATTITASFVIAAGATLGPQTVTVTTDGVTTATVMFTVNPPAPTLTSISPTSGVQGNVVPVTLTGTNFVAGSTINVPAGEGITVSGTTVASATSITATFTLSGTATLGAQTVSVTTAGGTTVTKTFTVLPPAPTLTAISPNFGPEGSSIPVTLTGTNLVAGATVAVSGTGVTVTNVTPGAGGTTLTATFVITAGATLGARTVSVTTAGGTSGTVTFTVNPPGPTLTSIAPAMGAQGNNVNVTLTGTNFVSPATINFGGAGVTVASLVVVSPTSITAQFQIGLAATLGAQTVSVTTASGTTANQTFTVEAPPTLISISPNAGDESSAPTVTLTGTNFFTPATINFGGTGITTSAVTVTSPTTITATFTIAAGAPLGAQTVSVTTDGVTTTTVPFTVNPPAPTLTTVSPAMGAQNGVVNVTLTGTNFVAGSTINVPAGEGIAVSGTTVASATSITATFTISGTATLGPQNVSVTTAGGTTANKTFTVEAAPTLASISPATGVQGTTVPVTLTGTNFFTPAMITFGGTGVTINNTTVTSPTTITAVFVIAAGATLGPQTVSVTTDGATTLTVTFTVNPPAPTLTSVSPNSGVQGNAVPVTLTGTNFVAGSTINVPAGEGITVSGTTVASATSITATFTLSGTATLGGQNVSVTTAGGTTGNQTFTVLPPAPTLISISPTSGAQGATVPVTLTGTNLVAGATVAVSGGQVTVNNIVPSGTTLTATFVIAGAATSGAHTVTVTTAGGTSGTVTFTVNETATISSASSTTFTVGTAGTFTVTTTGGVPTPALTETGALPAGVTFTDNGNGTATLAGTPGAATGGTYTLTIKATNTAGTATQAFTLTVDQAPAITSANNTTFSTGIAGTFTVTATGFPVPTFSETGALPTGVTLTAAGVLSGTPAAGTGGTYPITITATNTAGAAPQAFTLTVDQTASFTSANATTFTVGTAGTFSVTTTGGIPTPALSETGALPTGVTFVDNGNGTATLAGTPGAGTGGTYAITLKASNAGGAAAQAFTLTVDQTPAITSAAATTLSVGTAGTFTVTATGFPAPAFSETGALPTGVTLSAAGVLSGTPAAGTGGTYAITIKAMNTAGSTTQAFTLTVDQTASITSANNTTFTVGTAGSFTVTTTGGIPTPALTETGALPSGVTFVDNGNGTATLAGTPGAGTGGTYAISIKVTNGGGTATQAFTLTVDQAPAITSANNTVFTVGNAGTFTVTATGFPAPTFSESGALPTGVTLTAAGVLSGTPAAGTGGTYPITITAMNSVGSTMQSFTLTVDQAPAITSANNTTLTVGTAGTFTVTATGQPTPALTETGALPTGVTFTDNGNGTATLAGTPGAATGGTYAITIKATNAGATATQAFTLTVDQAPAITSANATTFTVGTAGTFTVTATGFPAPTFTETGALPSGVTLSAAGVLSGTPAAGTGGTYAITITASNGVGTAATQSFTLTVDQTATISSANSTTFTVGVAGTFSVTTTGGRPTPALSETGALPTGVTFVDNGNGTATLAGTPGAGTGGTYAITIKAANTAGTASQAFTLTVDQAPVITSGAATTFVAGTAGTFTVTASGVPAPTFSETGALPPGVTLSTAGVLSGTATASGTFPIIITAQNSVGTSAPQSFTLTVNNPVPTLTSISPNNGVLATNPMVTLTGTGFFATAANTTIKFSGTGITATNITVVSSTSITATLTITTPAAMAGAQNVTVMTGAPGGGTSGTVAFTVGSNFTLMESTMSGSVMPGGSATATLTVTPTTAGATSFPAAVTFSFSGLPALTMCNAPNIAATGTTAPMNMSTLTCQTMAPSLLLPRAPDSTPGISPRGLMVLAWAGLLLAMAGAFATRRAPRMQRFAMGCVLVLAVAGLAAACGPSHGMPGTPPGTYPITVMANAGTAAPQTVTFTLTVQ